MNWMVEPGAYPDYIYPGEGSVKRKLETDSGTGGSADQKAQSRPTSALPSPVSFHLPPVDCLTLKKYMCGGSWTLRALESSVFFEVGRGLLAFDISEIFSP